MLERWNDHFQKDQMTGKSKKWNAWYNNKAYIITHYQRHVYTKQYHTVAFSINEQSFNSEEPIELCESIYKLPIFPAF